MARGLDWKTLFLSARGRIGRRDFWIGFAMVMAVSALLNFLGPVGKIVGFASLWPMVCLHAKRLHDAGRSAWLMLAPAAVTLSQVMVAATMPRTPLDGVLTVLTMAVSAGFLLWVGLSPGQPGANHFGEPPLSTRGSPG